MAGKDHSVIQHTIPISTWRDQGKSIWPGQLVSQLWTKKDCPKSKVGALKL